MGVQGSPGGARSRWVAGRTLPGAVVEPHLAFSPNHLHRFLLHVVRRQLFAFWCDSTATQSMTQGRLNHLAEQHLANCMQQEQCTFQRDIKATCK